MPEVFFFLLVDAWGELLLPLFTPYPTFSKIVGECHGHMFGGWPLGIGSNNHGTHPFLGQASPPLPLPSSNHTLAKFLVSVCMGVTAHERWAPQCPCGTPLYECPFFTCGHWTKEWNKMMSTVSLTFARIGTWDLLSERIKVTSSYIGRGLP